VLLAYACALVSPHVTARGIEASEFPTLAGRHGVNRVPAIVVGDHPAWTGNVPEQAFVERLLQAAAA
jgi:hypothetical protein